MISIADMAAHRSKILDYADLMQELEIANLRELEDLIVDCIYNNLVQGKLDQMNQQFHVVHTFGRDLREEDIGNMLQKLSDWDNQLEQTQIMIEKNVQGCNSSIMNNYERQLKLEMDLRDRRDAMIKDIHDGRDQDYGGSGPSHTMLKKKNSKKHEERDYGSGGGNFGGMQPGFFNR